MQCSVVCMQFCESQILNPCTIRYDTRCYFNVRSKANMSQLNLPHGECQMMSADVVTRLVYVTVPSARWLCSSYLANGQFLNFQHV